MKDLVSLGLKHQGGRLLVLDQRALPHEEIWNEVKSPDDMIGMIKTLAVRGAPLIGVAAALALAKYTESGCTEAEAREAARALREARPTAVNLMAAMDRISKLAFEPKRWLTEAEFIFDEDVLLCKKMAKNGATLIQDGDAILTHCNTGGLATAGIGTALGVIREAWESKKKIHVYVDETRPLLQGARLTAWELEKLGIPYTLICDNMAAVLMSKRKIHKAFVGSDRIAANGDAANKVGTYGVAVQCAHHNIPFYIVAPYTTIDWSCPNGEAIPIEERDADEVRAGKAPRSANVFNPAFDVTPAHLIAAIVTDGGIYPKGELQRSH